NHLALRDRERLPFQTQPHAVARLGDQEAREIPASSPGLKEGAVERKPGVLRPMDHAQGTVGSSRELGSLSFPGEGTPKVPPSGPAPLAGKFLTCAHRLQP